MNLREMNLRIFERQAVPHVFFQPRFEPWFWWHKTFSSLPERYQAMSVLDLYDELGASDRYFCHFTGLPDPIEIHYSPAVRKKTEITGEKMTTVFDTPHGRLLERKKMTADRIWRKVQFAVHTLDDLKKLEWLYENCTAYFNTDTFLDGAQFQADRGQPQFWIYPSPYEMLTQEWMAFEDFIYALVDVPTDMQRVMDAIDRSYDRMFEQIACHEAVKIVNFAENIHVVRTPPEYFERYLIPWYEKRSNQLRSNAVHTNIHIDGNFKPLLKYLKDLPFDGLEALTPFPQGDVTLEEIKEHIGGKILLDGIPAVLFLEHYSKGELQECVEKVVEYFHPRLILGISDELPQGGNEESIERVRLVANYCRKGTWS